MDPLTDLLHALGAATPEDALVRTLRQLAGIVGTDLVEAKRRIDVLVEIADLALFAGDAPADGEPTEVDVAIRDVATRERAWIARRG